MATVTGADAERAVLDAAGALFYERSLAGVTMTDIRDAAGVSLRRLYGLHPSKRDLVAAWLHDRHQRWMTWFTEAVQWHRAGGTAALLATFDALDDWVASPGYRGCAFLNTIAETSEIDDSHRTIVADHKRSLVAYLTSLAADDHPGGPAWLPGAIGVLLDGAIVQSAVFSERSPIAVARSAAQHLIEHAS